MNMSIILKVSNASENSSCLFWWECYHGKVKQVQQSVLFA